MNNHRKQLAVLLLFFFLFIGGRLAHAEGPAAVHAECKTVYECVDQNTSGPGDNGVKKESGESLTSQSEEGGSGFLTLIKVLAALGVVVGLLYIALKFLQKKTRTFQEGKILQSMAGIGVGANRSIQAVKVGSTIMIIGIGENVTLLKEITNEDEVEELLLLAEESPRKQHITARDLFVKVVEARKAASKSSLFANLLKNQIAQQSTQQQLPTQINRKKGKNHE